MSVSKRTKAATSTSCNVIWTKGTTASPTDSSPAGSAAGSSNRAGRGYQSATEPSAWK
jgi:hypothetical protein